MLAAKLLLMRTKLVRSTLQIFVSAVTLAGCSVLAQLPGGGAAGGMDALLRLFGDTKDFTAKVNVQVLDASRQEVASFPMQLTLLDKKQRVEMDLTQMKSKQMPAGMADTLKQMGMAQFVNIVRPDKKLAYSMYPTLKVVLTQPWSKASTEPKLERTEEGKETIDGHPCVKYKNVLTDDAGKKTEATSWNATDMKDFPVQIQAKDGENTSVLRFQQVQLTRPDEKLFEPPADYTQYTNQAELQQAVMAKFKEGALKK